MNYIRVGVPSDKGRRIGLGWDTQEGFTHICNVLFKKITRNEHSKNVEVNKARGWVCGCSSSLYTSANMRCFLYKENGNVSELSKSDSHACGTLVFMLSEEVHTEPESSTRESSTASLLSHPASGTCEPPGVTSFKGHQLPSEGGVKGSSPGTYGLVLLLSAESSLVCPPGKPMTLPLLVYPKLFLRKQTLCFEPKTPWRLKSF